MWLMVDSAGLYTITLATTLVCIILNITALAIMIEVVRHRSPLPFGLFLMTRRAVANADDPYNIYRLLRGFDSSGHGSSGRLYS